MLKYVHKELPFSFDPLLLVRLNVDPFACGLSPSSFDRP